jgi:predicted 3-demethylubiquinone-9 3-methyltransferase (glyoxalase superfamily)
MVRSAVQRKKESIMALKPQKIVPCLWFDKEAEAAANLYVSVFKDARILSTTRYGKEGFGQQAGTVMTVEFELEGQKFLGLNGGPQFKFSEAISFQIFCETQEEIDYFWSKLTADGGNESQCGWLKDKFGLSWQVVPTALIEILKSADAAAAQRVTKAFMQMKKFDIEALKQACNG